MRDLAENTPGGRNVDAAVSATDADGDRLTYSLEGTDQASFDIVTSSGQIRTKSSVTYDHEAKILLRGDGEGGRPEREQRHH